LLTRTFAKVLADVISYAYRTKVRLSYIESTTKRPKVVVGHLTESPNINTNCIKNRTLIKLVVSPDVVMSLWLVYRILAFETITFRSH
jgi:hypothetical protein